MSEPIDLSMFVTRSPEGGARMELALEGVGCASCIRKIETGLHRLPGIREARVNLTDRRLSVEWREGAMAAGDIIQAVERIGYRAYPYRPQAQETDEAQYARWLLKCL